MKRANGAGLQKIPASGPAREALRAKGQFWTPAWIAEAMVAYVLAGGSDCVFDPAVGGGAFFRAVKTLASQSGQLIRLLGSEIDPTSLEQALEAGLTKEDLRDVAITDFVMLPPKGTFSAIVANPPYIRHHRLSPTVKASLRLMGKRLLGRPLDGRAGYHVYFLLRALECLAPEGRLAFILPADIFEGVFAHRLWAWIVSRYTLDSVVTFSAEAAPFPNIDTNAVIVFLRNDKPADSFWWAVCREQNPNALREWVLSRFERPSNHIIATKRRIAEAVETGLSREPALQNRTGVLLGELATVMRGIATGANEFFFLTHERALALGLPDDCFVQAIGRTRDVKGAELTLADMSDLRRAGRPTLLLALESRALKQFPSPVRKYLVEGEERGIHKRPLICTRRPWYKMETRVPPPFLFAYLGRRNTRFIYNRAGVRPLTCFLCVYPRGHDHTFVRKLWAALNHPATLGNLRLVGKSYGNGALKVEPRALERLLIPRVALEEAGLEGSSVGTQLNLFQQRPANARVH